MGGFFSEQGRGQEKEGRRRVRHERKHNGMEMTEGAGQGKICIPWRSFPWFASPTWSGIKNQDAAPLYIYYCYVYDGNLFHGSLTTMVKSPDSRCAPSMYILLYMIAIFFRGS